MAVLGTTSYTQDNLVIDLDLDGDDYPVESGNSVTRGQVMKLVNGKLSPCLTTETPRFIMLEDVDASGADTVGTYMRAGCVLESEVNYNTGTAAEFREALQDAGIYTRSH